MGQQLQLVKGYYEDDCLRNSFNKLAEGIFGLNFENWYQQGFWTDKYLPYSFLIGNQIVANVSVNRLDFVINNEQKKGIQIGTVMTHPDYRNRGLSAKLMNQVLHDFSDQYDMMYLFANQSVLEFYPKFGFQRVEETHYCLDFTGQVEQKERVRKLDVFNENHLKLIFEQANQRVPVSRVFGTINSAELVMFYATYVFPDDIYYLEMEDAIVFCKQENHQVHLFDVISKSPVEMRQIVGRVAQNGTKEVIFHFTPDDPTLPMQKSTYQGSEVLFVKHPLSFNLPVDFKHPLTSQA